MRKQRVALLLLFLLAGLAACSPGHVGSDKIAFVHDGGLWTIYPDGTNAYEIANDPPVIGYGWSPDHQILVFRTIDDGFAKTAAAKHITSDPLTGLVGDLPAGLNTVGTDGGSPIPIVFSSPDVNYSNAWWNPTGNRLLYRLTTTTPGSSFVRWWVSQDDQPGGIASKSLPASYSIPSFAYNALTALGDSEAGIFTTTLAGTNPQFIVRGTLPGHPLPASLERVLWQPAHAHPGILYAIAASPGQSHQFGPTSIEVQLILRDARGRTTTLTTCACTQFAWSPDGQHVLESSSSSYTLLNLDGSTALTISAMDGSVPYWSPDSQFLLLDGLHSLALIRIADGQQQVILRDATASTSPVSRPPAQPAVKAHLQPVSNSPWAADSRRFLFITRDRLQWQGQRLRSGKGLYVASIDSNGQLQGSPTNIDTGNDSQAGWTYEDANTSFLF